MHCHRAVRQIVLVAVALVVSCDKSTAPRSTVPVASVTVSPAAASIALGQTVQLTATPRDSQGNGLAGRVVAWSTSDASVATVSGSGLVTAVAVGGATITATSEGKSAGAARSEEHTSELQSPCNLVCRLLLEKKKKNTQRS